MPSTISMPCCLCFVVVVFFSNMKVKIIITMQELFIEIKVIPKITGTNITPPLGNIFFPPLPVTHNFWYILGSFSKYFNEHNYPTTSHNPLSFCTRNTSGVFLNLYFKRQIEHFVGWKTNLLGVITQFCWVLRFPPQLISSPARSNWEFGWVLTSKSNFVTWKTLVSPSGWKPTFFSGEWDVHWRGQSIPLLELYTIVIKVNKSLRTYHSLP